MTYPLYVVALLVVAIALIARSFSNYISAIRFKQAHGTKPVRKLPQWERIIGYTLFKTQRQALKEKRLLEMSHRRYDTYGSTWSATILGAKFINTSDPENIKAVLATNFKDFGLGMRLESFGALLGQGIFTSDGTLWEHSRALVRPSFTRAQVADLSTFETHIQHLMAKIPREGATVDLQSLFFQLTMDSATDFLFGESVGSLTSNPGSEAHAFAAAFDFAQYQMGLNSRLGIFRYFVRDRPFEEACKTVHNFVDKIVYRALDAEKRSDGKEPERYVFLDELVKATKDPKVLRDELLNIFLAGRDTTASLLSHTFHVLAQRPDIYEKLQAEVGELKGKMPTYDSLRNMKYLKNLLNESLRLYPVVPSNARFANKATTIPRGGGPDGLSPVYVAKGQIVAYSVYTMHRSTSIYGPDAGEFKPERWDSPSLRPGWGYLPFNGGPRICVGQSFALTEASYTIVRLCQEFEEVRIGYGWREWREQLSLTMAVADGVNVIMVPRNTR